MRDADARATDPPVRPRKRRPSGEPNPLVTIVMQRLEDQRGYVSEHYAGEAKAVKGMLGHDYTPDEIMAAYLWLKQQPWWRDKALTTMSLAGQIGEWKRMHGNGGQPTPRGQPARPTGSALPPPPEPTAAELAIEEYMHQEQARVTREANESRQRDAERDKREERERIYGPPRGDIEPQPRPEPTAEELAARERGFALMAEWESRGRAKAEARALARTREDLPMPRVRTGSDG